MADPQKKPRKKAPKKKQEEAPQEHVEHINLVLPTKRKRNKVAIVGCSKSREEVPWDDDTFEFWGVNNAFITYLQEAKEGAPNRLEQFTRWFELHPIDFDGKTWKRREQENFRGQSVNAYIQDLTNLGEKWKIPVYMQKAWKEIPNSTVFPAQVILNIYGDYITNSISWFMAMALLEGFQEIHIYGVDMAVSSRMLDTDEYSWQRPSCEYFIGLARGLGVRVVIPDTSDLLKSRFLYGYDEPKQSKFNKKLSALVRHLKKTRKQTAMEANRLQEEIRARDAKINQTLGAEQAIVEMQKLWDDCTEAVDQTPPWEIKSEPKGVCNV